ncbi:HEPN domain-containing protein [Pedobacter sp. SYP-B3415]|uniref:HEPN domain-containing protein n=1 Tax=Pedobacter sp. SYP-B3415 TaxID=2496641 RepID=UPI00101C22D7|nr:HEPN domain-containing protein [Pedobacter sp. SYP-B3415]
MSGCEVIDIQGPVSLADEPLDRAPDLSSCPPGLRPALKLILSQLPVVYVFLVCTQTSTPHLLVVCGPACDRKLAGFEPLVELALLSCPLSFGLYSYASIRSLLSAGNPYYSVCCRVNNLIYMKQGFAIPPAGRGANMHMLASAARFEQGMGRSLAFYENAASFLSSGQLGMAAFSMHQTCEQSLRILALCVRGREIRSHSPTVLYRHARTFAALDGSFGAVPAEETRMLRLLEEAYSGARYDEAYTISESDAFRLFDLCGGLVSRCCEAFTLYIDNWLAKMQFEG